MIPHHSQSFADNIHKSKRQHNGLKENTILGMRIPRENTSPNTTGIFVEGCSVVLIPRGL